LDNLWDTIRLKIESVVILINMEGNDKKINMEYVLSSVLADSKNEYKKKKNCDLMIYFFITLFIKTTCQNKTR